MHDTMYPPIMFLVLNAAQLFYMMICHIVQRDVCILNISRGLFMADDCCSYCLFVVRYSYNHDTLINTARNPVNGRYIARAVIKGYWLLFNMIMITINL